MKFIDLTPENIGSDGDRVPINPHAIAYMHTGEDGITSTVLLNGQAYGVRESEEQIKMLCAEV